MSIVMGCGGGCGGGKKAPGFLNKPKSKPSTNPGSQTWDAARVKTNSTVTPNARTESSPKLDHYIKPK